MMPATSQTPRSIRKQIGPTWCLLALLCRFAPAEWTGDGAAWVAGGAVIADAELAERLGVSLKTIATWRRRLRKLGLLGWYVAPGAGRVFWVGPVNRAFANFDEAKPPEEKPAGETGTAKTEALTTAPSASRWVQ
jgi:hypothetical protein